jgi:RNA polymerase subunit RPABC4/transcription elongation factor Spt4
MALVNCAECSKEISSLAPACPSCGAPQMATSGSKPTSEVPRVVCPKCGSDQLTAKTRGFALGRALVGDVVFGPLGLLVGAVGRRKPNRRSAASKANMNWSNKKCLDAYPATDLRKQSLNRKKLCRFSKSLCFVSFWVAGTDIPKSLPMTDAQVASQVVQWDYNANTGLRRFLWSCKVFQDKSKDQCF